MSIWQDIGGVIGTNSDDRDKANSEKVGLDPTAYRRQNALNSQARENARRYENLAKNENYANRQRQLEDDKSRNQRREAPVAYSAQVGPLSNAKGATVDRSQIGGQSSFRDNQSALIAALEAQSRGEGPSLAQMQFQKNTDRNLKNLMAAAASARGAQSAGATMRNLADAQAQAQGDAAIASGELRLQEQNAARAQLAGAIGQGLGYDTGYRGQQIGLASQDTANQQAVNLANSNAWNQARMAEAAFNNQTSLANQQAQMNLMGMNQQSDQFYNTAELGLDQQQIATRMMAAQMFQNEQMQANAIASGQQQGVMAGQTSPKDVYQTVVAGGAGILGGLASAISTSDEETKKEVSEASKESKAFLTSLGKSLDANPESPDMPNINAGAMAAAPAATVKSMFYGGNNVLADLSTNPMLTTVGGSGVGTSPRKNIIGAISGKMNPMGNGQGIIASSDKNGKKEVKNADPKKLLDALEAKTFKYKNPEKEGSGKHMGVMAQDLEKAGPIGKSMVFDTPEGKKVDYGKGFGAILAAQVELNKRIEALEKLKKGKK